MKRHEEVRPPEMDWPLLRARIAELEAIAAEAMEAKDIIREQRARIVELEAERDRLKIERQALWGKLLLVDRRRSTRANSEA